MSKKDYRSYLEYGLATTYSDNKKPFEYSLKMEGIDDKITEKKYLLDKEEKQKTSNKNSQISEKTTEDETFENNNSEKKVKTVDGFEEGTDEKSITTGDIKTQKAASRVRPLLYAKFDTANYLLLIDRVKNLTVEEIHDYYSMTYNKEITKRIASVDTTIRLLERGGEYYLDGIL